MRVAYLTPFDSRHPPIRTNQHMLEGSFRLANWAELHFFGTLVLGYLYLYLRLYLWGMSMSPFNSHQLRLTPTTITCNSSHWAPQKKQLTCNYRNSTSGDVDALGFDMSAAFLWATGVLVSFQPCKCSWWTGTMLALKESTLHHHTWLLFCRFNYS